MEVGKRSVSAFEITQLAQLYRMPVAHFLYQESAVTDLLSDHPGLDELLNELSARDRYEVLRFAEFLRYQAGGPRSKPTLGCGAVSGNADSRNNGGVCFLSHEPALTHDRG
jgi:hypothetical protein